MFAVGCPGGQIGEAGWEVAGCVGSTEERPSEGVHTVYPGGGLEERRGEAGEGFHVGACGADRPSEGVLSMYPGDGWRDHWRQNVCMLGTPLRVAKGEMISVRVVHDDWRVWMEIQQGGGIKEDEGVERDTGGTREDRGGCQTEGRLMRETVQEGFTGVRRREEWGRNGHQEERAGCRERGGPEDVGEVRMMLGGNRLRMLSDPLWKVRPCCIHVLVPACLCISGETREITRASTVRMSLLCVHLWIMLESKYPSRFTHQATCACTIYMGSSLRVSFDVVRVCTWVPVCPCPKASALCDHLYIFSS